MWMFYGDIRMVYYKDEICLIRNLEKDDIEEILQGEGMACQ